jgi:hypothetical protein
LVLVLNHVLVLVLNHVLVLVLNHMHRVRTADRPVLPPGAYCRERVNPATEAPVPRSNR